MIYVIDSKDKHQAPRIIDEMHRLRARVFHDRMGWEVVVRNGRERDHFDALDPVYLVHVDGEGRVLASLRLLTTTGPHMLSDTFPQLMEDGEPLRSPTIWESSRFCVDTAQIERNPRGHTISQVTGELLCGAYALGLEVGLTHFTSAFDAMMHRVLRRAGAEHDKLGPPQRVGRVMAMAGLFEIAPERIDVIRERCGVTGRVLAPFAELVRAEATLVPAP